MASLREPHIPRGFLAQAALLPHARTEGEQAVLDVEASAPSTPSTPSESSCSSCSNLSLEVERYLLNRRHTSFEGVARTWLAAFSARRT